MRKHSWSFQCLPIRCVQLESASAPTLSGKRLHTNIKQSIIVRENSEQALLCLLTAGAKASKTWARKYSRNSQEKGRQKDLTFPSPCYNYKRHEGTQVLQNAASLPLPSRSCWFSRSVCSGFPLIWSVCESQVKFHSSALFKDYRLRFTFK